MVLVMVVEEEQREYAAGDVTSSRKRPRRVVDEPSADEASCFPAKLARQSDSDSSRGSGEAKRIEEDLLNILDDADELPAIQGLDSVIRSFEEEILLPTSLPPPAIRDEVTVPEHGDSSPVLGRLLEASDDELGLPPMLAAGKGGEIIGSADSPAVDGRDRCGEGIPFESDGNDRCDDFEALAELFDESNETNGDPDPAEISELQWRPESLSAS
ncbi:unnamed protein product [Linum tenue]|uniref:Uncharacterized protein n=1 Tax=Linum tenue TaxID=586396 RepID=A0AAV0QSI3_9ROSI|nr:unnamed protein product [Linum tenue]